MNVGELSYQLSKEADPTKLFSFGVPGNDPTATMAKMLRLLAIYAPEAEITGAVADDENRIVALQLDGVTPKPRGWMMEP